MVVKTNADAGSCLRDIQIVKPNDECPGEGTIKKRKHTGKIEATTSATIAEPFSNTEVTKSTTHEDGECDEADAAIAYTHRRWIHVGILCLAIVAHGISTTVIFPFASFMVCYFNFGTHIKRVVFTNICVDRSLT